MKEGRISDIAGEVLRDGSIGLWIIELDAGCAPRMYGDARMLELVGGNESMTPEELYNQWYVNVHDDYYQKVNLVVQRMSHGIHSEVQYPWHDDVRGYINVRCGGTRDNAYAKGIRLKGYHQDITSEDDTILAQINENTEKKLQLAEQMSEEHLAILTSISRLYYSMHLIDLQEDDCVTYNTSEEIEHFTDSTKTASEQLKMVMEKMIVPEQQDSIQEFIDLSTLPKRMKNKESIADEFIGIYTGWFVAEFVIIDKDENGSLKSVLFTTRIIDDQKRREAKLIKMSNTDGLTSLENRRSYEQAVKSYRGVPKSEIFTFIALDVNGLKNINDTLGHDAGDELLIGASKCMSKSFSRYGTVFRIGGDEFIAILEIDEIKLKKVIDDFEKKVKEWRGTMVDKLSVSMGIVTKKEFSNMTVENMAKIADKRMYEAKNAYYIENGIDRRRRG